MHRLLSVISIEAEMGRLHGHQGRGTPDKNCKHYAISGDGVKSCWPLDCMYNGLYRYP